MVEVLMKRKEILPDDESAEQHYQRKTEEIREVENDRNGPDGLFKGCFPIRNVPWRDEAEGVMRCPGCGHEHIGGPECENCGIELDVDDFFSDIEDDFDDDALEEYESGLDDIEIQGELGNEFMANRDHPHNPYLDPAVPRPPTYHAFVQHYQHHHHHHRYPTTDPSDGSDMDSEEENEGSLHEFVVPDDEEPVRAPGRNRNNNINNSRPITVVTISDDDDDSDEEGGAVSNRRPQHRGRPVVQFSHPAPSVISLTNTTRDSEAGDDEADMLRHAGWSPLAHGDDSDADGPEGYGYDGYHAGNDVTEDDQDSDEESDTNTETMVGNPYTGDDDDYESREPSLTPGYAHPQHPLYELHDHFNAANRHNVPDEHFDADSELEHSSEWERATDREGDTEMTPEYNYSPEHSLSPGSPEASRSASIASTVHPHSSSTRNPYSESRSSRGVSLRTNSEYGGVSESSMGGRGGSVDSIGYGHGNPDLGVANEMHEVEDLSDDDSIRTPHRRQPRRYHQNSRTQQYDPRISMIFAEVQTHLRVQPPGTQNNPIGLDEWNEEPRRVEPASRHRRMNAYRNMPERRVDPLRSSRSPSATRIISVADRSSRIPRQYRRN
jgi:hypothetical protein